MCRTPPQNHFYKAFVHPRNDWSVNYLLPISRLAHEILSSPNIAAWLIFARTHYLFLVLASINCFINFSWLVNKNISIVRFYLNTNQLFNRDNSYCLLLLYPHSTDQLTPLNCCSHQSTAPNQESLSSILWFWVFQ